MIPLSEVLPDSPLLQAAQSAFADVLDAIDVIDAVVVVAAPAVTAVFDLTLHADLTDEDDPDDSAPDPATADEVDWTVVSDVGPLVAEPALDPAAETTLSLHVDASVLDPLVIPIPGLEIASLVIDPQSIAADIIAREDGYQIALQAALGVRIDGALLRPMRLITRADGTTAYEPDESRPHAEIRVASARATLDSTNAVTVDLGLGARFESPVMVGDTGVIVEADEIALTLGPDPALQVGQARVVCRRTCPSRAW